MTDETTGLRERIDGWLDGLPQPAAQPFVHDAIAAGDRIRRRRRQGTVLAVAAAVLALGVGGALLRSTVEAPGPAPSPGGPTGPTPSASASGRTPTSGTTAAPSTVRYPDGTVTWPAPGAEPGWVLPGVLQQGTTEVGTGLRDGLIAAVPGSAPIGGSAADAAVGAGITQSGPPGRTTDLRVEVLDVDGPRIGLLTVRMTRGGVSDEPLAAVMDFCGSWPAGSPGLGLLDEERSVFFEEYPDRTCSLHRAGGSTFVRWEGGGSTPDSPADRYSTRAVFTVRPNGTAVHVASSTRADPNGQDLRRPRAWADLEQLASTLPVPAGLGAVADRPADCTASDLEARLGRDATGTGSVRVEIVLRNTGGAPCWLGGLPTFAGVDATGREVPLDFTGDALEAFSGDLTGPGVLEAGADGAVWLTEATGDVCPAADRLPRYGELEVRLSGAGTVSLPFPEQLALGCPGRSSQAGPLPRS